MKVGKLKNFSLKNNEKIKGTARSPYIYTTPFKEQTTFTFPDFHAKIFKLKLRQEIINLNVNIIQNKKGKTMQFC